MLHADGLLTPTLHYQGLSAWMPLHPALGYNNPRQTIFLCGHSSHSSWLGLPCKQPCNIVTFLILFRLQQHVLIWAIVLPSPCSATPMDVELSCLLKKRKEMREGEREIEKERAATFCHKNKEQWSLWGNSVFRVCITELAPFYFGKAF